MRPFFGALACVVCGACAAEPPVDCPDGARLVRGEFGGRGEMSMWCERGGVPDGRYVRAIQKADGPDGPTLGPHLVEGRFDDGLADGEWRYFTFASDAEQGPLERIERYERGYPDGVWQAFDPEGTTLWEHTWRLGTACGTWRDGDGTTERGDCADVDEPPPIDPTMAARAIAPAVTCDGTTPSDDPTTSGCVDGAGLYQGPFIRWYTTMDGADGGERVPAAFGTMRDGRRQGAWTLVHANGFVAARGSYVDDHEEGVWETFASDRRRLEVGPYSAGRRDGAFETFNANGSRESTGQWVDGERAGAWTFNYDTGVVFETVAYAAGRRDGTYVRHHDNGNVELEGRFADDLETGLWKTYYDDTTPAAEDTYVRGRREGPAKAFGLDGLPISEGRYVAGLAEGTWHLWEWQFEERIALVGEVVRGELVGPWVGTHEGGAKAREVTYRDNHREGPTKQWWKNGQLQVDGAWSYGLAHGRWQTWQPDGTPFIDATYVYGRLWGPYRSWWPSGAPHEEGAYADDQKIGTWTYWSEDGQPRQETYQ